MSCYRLKTFERHTATLTRSPPTPRPIWHHISLLRQTVERHTAALTWSPPTPWPIWHHVSLLRQTVERSTAALTGSATPSPKLASRLVIVSKLPLAALSVQRCSLSCAGPAASAIAHPAHLLPNMRSSDPGLQAVTGVKSWRWPCRWLAEKLAGMRHPGGSRAVCVLYGAHACIAGAAPKQAPETENGGAPKQAPPALQCFPGAVGQGPVVAFNVLRADGAYVGYRCARWGVPFSNCTLYDDAEQVSALAGDIGDVSIPLYMPVRSL